MRPGCFAVLMIRIHLRYWRNLSIKEAIRKPLNSSKFASIRHKMFTVNIDEEKFNALNKKHNILGNCSNKIVPKCDAEISKNNLTSP